MHIVNEFKKNILSQHFYPLILILVKGVVFSNFKSKIITK